MSTTQTININYGGKRAAGYIAGAIAAGKMISEGHITQLWGVKNDMNVPVMKLNGLITDYSDDFIAAGEIELSDKQLSPKPLSVMFELGATFLRSLYESEQMMAGMNGTMPTASFEQFLIAYMQKQIRSQMDNLIWNSDTAITSGSLSKFDGLIKQITSAPSPTVITVPATTLTTGNILEELAKVYIATPDSLSGDEANFRYFCSSKTQKLLNTRLYGMVGKSVKESKTLPFDPESLLVPIPNFPNNTFVGTSVNNIFFAGDAESDISNVNIVDMMPTTADRKFRFRMDFSADVKIAFANEIVYYAD